MRRKRRRNDRRLCGRTEPSLRTVCPPERKGTSINTICLISLGCAKNLVDSEQMLHLIDEAGYQLVSRPEAADAVVINTCAFIDEAKQEAINTVLEMDALRRAGGMPRKIIVAGCLAQRYHRQIAESLPEADAVVGIGSFRGIVGAIRQALAGERAELLEPTSLPVMESPRMVSTGPAWAYLRIAEGCSNRCAFCAIPAIRGPFRSRPMERIVDEARTLAASGVKELIVIAQDVTRYGEDLYGKRCLAALCRALCAVDGIEWIRLHYLYPDEFDSELIDTIASEPKILKYLDIPIQHIDDTILRRMNRRGTSAEIRALFAELRRRIPNLVLRTSLITGLPGEGETEFEALAEFLRAERIERAGVFAYSPEEGTPAALMQDRCSEEEAQRRRDLLMQLQQEVMEQFEAGRIGTVVRVLCTGFDDDGYCVGRSWAESPDIDGVIHFDGPAQPGEWANVELSALREGEPFGEQI